MFNLPETPINSAIAVAAIGTLTVTAYAIKKRSEDHQCLINAHTEARQIDATQQANMLRILKEMTTKTLR